MLNASRTVVLILVVLGLVAGSLVPWPLKVLLGTTGAAHAPLHIASFALATLVVTHRASRSASAWAGAALMTVGLIIEVMQWTMFQHDFEWLDIVYDTSGVLIALVGGHLREAPSLKRETP